MDNPVQQFPATRSPATPSHKPFLLMIIIVLLVFVSIVSAYYFLQFRDLQQKLHLTYQELTETNSKLQQSNQEAINLKNQVAVLEEKSRPTPTPVYCEGKMLYENIPQTYRVCYPKGWYTQTANDLKENVTFSVSPNATEHVITINVTREDSEAALKRLAKNVYVDSTNRNYKVNNVPAIQIVGTQRASKMGITVVTVKGKTYEVVLTNKIDATFSDYLKLYAEFLESFQFVEG